jgi:membrane protein implicated in regulation of membrane protease activity
VGQETVLLVFLALTLGISIAVAVGAPSRLRSAPLQIETLPIAIAAIVVAMLVWVLMETRSGPDPASTLRQNSNSLSQMVPENQLRPPAPAP